MAKTANNGAIGIGSSGETYFINMAAAPGTGEKATAGKMRATIPDDKLRFMPWSPWGANNLLPQEMTVDVETCGILSAIIDGKARFAMCDGIRPVIMKLDEKTGKQVIEKYVDAAEIIDFLRLNNHYFHTYAWMKDLFGMGNGVVRFMLNGGRDQIVSFQRDDITEVRYEKKDERGKIKNLYYSGVWNLVVGEKDNRIFTVPLLDWNNPVKDLKDRAKEGNGEFAMTFRYPGWGKHYYSIALWYAAYKWVKIAQGVPEMKAAMFENSMRLKYMVIIFEQYWQDAYANWDDMTDKEKETARNELYDQIDSCLVGARNSHKTLFVDGKLSLDGKPQPYIEVKAIEDSTKNGEYLPDSAAANSEIAFAMLWNNGLQGGNQKSGLYEQNQGGSNVREAGMMQTIIHEFERKVIQYVMDVVKYFNGWDKKYPGLEFIIQATVLTTLDTGSSSKSVNTGGIEDKKEDNGTNKNSSGS